MLFLTRFSKKNVSATSLLKGMTDIHTHILPGVDDGIQKEQEAIEVLSYLKDTGIEKVYMTPHIMNDLKENCPDKLKEKFSHFKENCPVKIILELAGEYMLDQNFLKQLDLGLLSFNNKHVLLETSYLSPPPDFIEMIFEVEINGYHPILAHPERYIYMQQKDYDFLKEKGCKFQLNLFSLSGYYGKQPMINAKKLLRQGMYDFTGSDLHHLNGYKRGIENCNLSVSEIKELKKILTNNQSL